MKNTVDQFMSVTESSIGKVRHNFGPSSWKPFLPKGFSNFEIHHIVSGILGVAIGVAGLLLSLRDGKVLYLQVPWTAGQRALSKVEYTVAGLQNLGNNCFLNVVLQALASCGSFRFFLRNTLEADDVEIEERAEKFPLSVALVFLLEELCTVREKRIVLSPRKVMLAMSSYVSNFNLSRQQDAAEAFLLLLSSLEEELLQRYVPPCGSLMDVSAFSCKISSPKLCREEKSECQRWQRYLFGQFDGIVGSILTCRSCSSQLSLDFQFFRCLHIAPVLDRNGAVKDSCTLEDCLKSFTTTESLESYCCYRCSHIKALKYLCLRPEENKVKIERIGQCVKFDSCDCRSLFTRDGPSWPTGSSNASKRLVIARCPKILCVHLQRAAMGLSGEMIKVQGHVSFPLVLDLFPFTAAAKDVELGTSGETILERAEKHQASAFVGHHLGMQQWLRALPCLDNLNGGDFSGESHTEMAPSSSSILRLISVVEHYGGSGGGHYAVYRKLTVDPHEAGPMVWTQGQPSQWFYISDHRVSPVSEEAVLGAEASLLFYERVNALTP
ncbi:unnamed protein product [Spirodela intermedia]|uniref:ubiquitinyl hydrolase 1 n=1 Tax=Spirodela intermedia TaxID=51605 RepID=A0A7I8JBS9_SPIIN|nr:unnamed protein product [Spirodela intermedia]CAA6667658.1 unnamed protein product [Spirodela intermedia]